MDEPRLEPGVKRGHVLVVQGYRYQKQRESHGEFVWRCWRRDCRTKLRTNAFNDGEQIRVANMNDARHNHPEDDGMTSRINVRRAMQAAATRDPTVPARRVYAAEVARLHRQGGGDRPPVPSLASVRTCIERVRRHALPPIPQGINDVRIENQWGQTWNREEFLLYLDNQWGICVFATAENLNILRHCQTVYIDGTFRVCPRPYTQLLVIVGNFNGYGLPLAHALMAQRTVGHYRQVLQAVCRRTRELTHHRWRPTLVVTDFEIGLQNAVHTEIPTADVRGCYFHFSQALWRKIQEIGLSNAYRNNDGLKALVRKVMALGYLPLPLVRLNYNRLLQERDTRRQVRRFPALQDFLQYVSRTYVDRGATFNVLTWNVFNRGMEQRTNNIVESIHHSFSGAVQVRHPMFWNFLRHLKDQQATTEQQITAAQNGNAPPPRRRKWRDLERIFVNLKNQYNNGARNLDDYWRAVAHAAWNP